MIKFIDMFAGIGGFREGLTRAGGFTCVGHCEIDKHADRSYRALFDTEGEWFIEDARKADPETMPEFQLLCGGFPCQAFSTAGSRKGFGDPRGTLFFELARLAQARQPQYLLFENVPGLLNHDGGRTFATILNTLDRLGYAVEWQCLNSKDFGVPQSRKRVYIIGYLDARCRGKVFPFTETAGTALVQKYGGPQGKRVYSPEGVSCTLTAMPGGFGGKTGLYEVGLPIKCATNTGYQLAEIGDSIDLSYATINSRRGRVGKEIAHTLTTGCRQGTVDVCPVKNPIKSDPARNAARTGKPGAPMNTLTTKDRHGVLYEGRIRRLTPRECLRLQGWTDDRIDTVPTRILYIDYDADGQPTFCAASSRVPQLLRSALWNTREPAILTSGTLAAAGDFSHTEQLLGLAAYAPLRHFRADSPFNYKKKCLLYFPPRVKMQMDNRKMAEEIVRLVGACHGHALVLFTSYRQMAEVRALTDGQWTYPTYQAWRNGGKIIQKFKQSGNGVLFAAGSCWEGIDFPGDMVSLLIIAKLPFPIPDPVSDYERRQYPNLRDYINAEIIPEMQKKLRQGFGRAIRTEQDSCVVAILDERAGIGGKYHDAALAALPTCPTTEKIEDVQQFIREQKRPDYFL